MTPSSLATTDDRAEEPLLSENLADTQLQNEHESTLGEDEHAMGTANVKMLIRHLFEFRQVAFAPCAREGYT
jgi:hypothetical protein